MIIFAFPWAFALLLLPPIFYYLLPPMRGMYGNALRIPFIDDLKRISLKNGGLWKVNAGTNEKISGKFVMLYIVWALLCLAAARPQIADEPQRLPNEGRDIMLVLDISTSMLEPDFNINGHAITRLEAVKKTVADFVQKRANDRIGLILFGTRAYLQSPLTYDKATVKNILFSMKAGMAGDSTSIGDALALALKNIQAPKNKKSQIIILLTDGENNDGSLSMAGAMKLAAQEDVKIYTIGVGSPNLFFRMLSAVGLHDADENELKNLAEMSKGQYFRASSAADLQKVYQIIDSLEASNEDARFVQKVDEVYYIPLIAAWLFALIASLMQRSKKND